MTDDGWRTTYDGRTESRVVTWKLWFYSRVVVSPVEVMKDWDRDGWGENGWDTVSNE